MKKPIRTVIKTVSLLLCLFWFFLLAVAIADLFHHPLESEPLGAAMDRGLRFVHFIMALLGALISAELAASLFVFWRLEGARGLKCATLISASVANLPCYSFAALYISFLIQPTGGEARLLAFALLVLSAPLLFLLTLSLLIALGINIAKQRKRTVVKGEAL